MAASTREWVKVSTSAQGKTTISVSLQRGAFSSRYAVNAFTGQLAKGVLRAREGASKHLTEIEQAMGGDSDGE